MLIKGYEKIPGGNEMIKSSKISILNPLLLITFLLLGACHSKGVKSESKSTQKMKFPNKVSKNNPPKISEDKWAKVNLPQKSLPLSQEKVVLKPNQINAKEELARSTFFDSTNNKDSSRKNDIELSEKEKVFFELSGENVNSITEIGAYRKVIEKYQINDGMALKAYTQLLIKKFPRSIYCDNALYLLGMMYFTENKYGESLNAFQKIITQYPQSNKAVSALFAKGVVFKKMNLNKESMQILSQVYKLYPGSPESLRAEIEMKLISQSDSQVSR